MISGISAHHFAGIISEAFIAKLRKAAKGTRVVARADEDYLLDIKNKKNKCIKLSNLGWKNINLEKHLIMVKLESPIVVGITMEGGNRRYERVCVSHSSKDAGGEWYGRQFLSDDEAIFFRKMELRPINQPTSVIMGGVRGLPRVSEFDECLMRQTINKYSSQLSCELSALITTITHEWPINSKELRDEPIIVVFLMDGNFKDADTLGRFMDCYARNESVVKQSFGSLDVQFFLKIESINNRPFWSSPDACILEIDRCEKGAHMITLLRLLGDDEASRTLAVVRMDND
jgi:hypothetical protein